MQEENENLKEEDLGPPLTCSFYGPETTIMERRTRILFGFSSFVPLDQWQCQGTFEVVPSRGRGMLLGSRGYRPGMLLNTLPNTGQHPPPKKKRTSQSQVSLARRLGKPAPNREL